MNTESNPNIETALTLFRLQHIDIGSQLLCSSVIQLHTVVSIASIHDTCHHYAHALPRLSFYHSHCSSCATIDI